MAGNEGRNQPGGWPPRSPGWWCPAPERWHSDNDDASEHEVSALAAAFVTALQPDVVVETGSHTGQTAKLIGEALARNGQGHLYTVEYEPQFVDAAKASCAGLPVTVVHSDSVTWLTSGDAPDGVGFAWVDGLWENRIPDIEALWPHFTPGAICGIHDTGPQFPWMEEQTHPPRGGGEGPAAQPAAKSVLKDVTIINQGTATVYLSQGTTTASATPAGLQLAAGNQLTIQGYNVTAGTATTGNIWGICATGLSSSTLTGLASVASVV